MIGHWECSFAFCPDDWFGFTYRITNLKTGRQYVGKKQFRSRIRKKVANRKNRKVIYKDSNWQRYTGSSKELNEDIKQLGKDQFRFEIISLHETKASLYYAEVHRQIVEDVLRARLPNGEKKYYNKAIAAVKFSPPAITDKEKAARKAEAAEGTPMTNAKRANTTNEIQ